MKDQSSFTGASRREFLGLLSAAATAGPLAGMASALGAAPARRPNFLVIVADDMGFSDVGCYGGEIDTPNLNRLAANGVRFTQFYSTARCWPSRACILTGYYAQQVRMDPPRGRLPGFARCLPHHLRPLGYRCYHSGKWHVQGAPRVVADGGFDRSYRLDDHDRYFWPKTHVEDDRPLPAVQPGSDFYVTRHIADHAIRCLKEHAEQHADKPFFEYLAFTSPHFPLHALRNDIDKYRDAYLAGWDRMRRERWKRQREMGIVNCDLSSRDEQTVPRWNLKPEELREKIGAMEVGRAVAWDDLTDEQKRFQATKMAIHAAMIDRMDQEIGRVLEQVRAMGAWEDTVVFFVSDNGASAEQIIRGDMHDPAAEPGSGRSYLGLGPGWAGVGNAPFRLYKSWVHEGGISSPLIVHWPNGIATRGGLRHAPGHFVDFLPTLLDLAGGKPLPATRPTDPPPAGKSLVPAFCRDASIDREYLYFNHDGHYALRMGDWKLVSISDEQWELYDLSRDRCEQVNLASSEPDRVRRMGARWKELETEFRRQAQ
jgi:arylsulfatase